MLFAAVPELIAGLLAPNSGKLAFALFVGALVGSVIYTAVFVLASVLTTRAIAAGLLYVLIWEGLLGNIVGGARILSIAHYSLGIANAIYPDKDLNAGLGLSTSLVLGIVVTVGALVLASRRLSSFAIKGEPRDFIPNVRVSPPEAPRRSFRVPVTAPGSFRAQKVRIAISAGAASKPPISSSRRLSVIEQAAMSSDVQYSPT